MTYKNYEIWKDGEFHLAGSEFRDFFIDEFNLVLEEIDEIAEREMRVGNIGIIDGSRLEYLGEQARILKKIVALDAEDIKNVEEYCELTFDDFAMVVIYDYKY